MHGRRIDGSSHDNPSRGRIKSSQKIDPLITINAGTATNANELLRLFEEWKRLCGIMTASEKIMGIAESIHLLLKQKEERASDRGSEWGFNIKTMNQQEKNGFKKVFGVNNDLELQEYFDQNNLYKIIKLFLFLNRLFPYVDKYKESEQFKKNRKIDYQAIEGLYKDNEEFGEIDIWYNEFNTEYKEKIQDFLKNQ